MKIKTLIISIGLAIFFIGGSIWLFSSNDTQNTVTASNVTTADGRQVIQIMAKGGYVPRGTQAKANMETTLKIETNGTYDCSSALTIPSLGYETNLPPSGETVINVPPQQPGTTLRGLCAMGMYNFSVQFN